ncbi:hypothetical protein N6L24_04055 [Cognatishimia sp. SS12]|uniref:hypothetical protein n=1 Tax=Cognatishimia sp. SS12 TaxID=2979465 RepID=UPI00232F9AA9|nr:hypothetical protein [Cognatishimia sp. SS12]MDC0737437.1 hypothetical protein [Cognatishimia sp. SS12]
MTYQDRNNVVSILVNLLTSSYVILRLLEMSAAGQFDGPDAVNVWARMVIWVIPISIAATIVGTIVFNILWAIFTGTAKPSFVVDERDKLFDRRAIFAIVVCAGVGFISSVIALAMGSTALVGFNIIYFAMALGSFGADMVKFISYRRGY